ncbi:cell wall proline rich protein [Aspergillus nomiae NRRL 13137]|uniref:Cell wall proline rich protein n=1 Tax=Aspergillus nomiae NRRL (strain ATCC 15546 / NRRL 13137 / CBS 260.88 / M93) TaxID=1509407 RepID=A0A0L1JD58_ASPN3|nr:cell wall proline rich protein [Aspergillus nomiae NRRL 13137]KNG89642.1 cell wall proline rich protein [Aspergillus nomiae NRRL 13137]
MASISLPLQPQTTSAFSQYLDSTDRFSGRHNRRNLTMSTPLPNPPFIFPARDPDATTQTSAAPSSGPPPLPAFSFNPGSAHSSQPSMPNLPVNRAGGHRRRCSEFVGGEQLVSSEPVEASRGNEVDLNTTPTKLPIPGPGFSAGGPGKRRHAHRRSAAISSVDLTAISNTLDLKPAVGSAPLFSTGAKRDLGASDEALRPTCYSATTLGRFTPPASPRIVISDESLPVVQPETARDRLTEEQPISEISKGSGSTVRPDDTTRNSEKPGPFTSEPSSSVDRTQKPRPRTADASLMLDPNTISGTDDASRMKRPLSATGHSRFRKSISSGIIDAALRRHHGDDSRWAESSRHSSSDDGDSYASTEDARGSFESTSASKKNSKAKKRQKKVRSWAGAILTRGKGKRHQSKKDETKGEANQSEITPPAIKRTNSDLGSAVDVNFDDDEDIVIIRTPTNPAVPKSNETTSELEPHVTLENSWKPRSFYEQTTQNDALSPIIDLDAALGPFNTPDGRSRGAPESGFSAATKRMYSGGRRGEFVGPEMRYHRRTESAPEMPPFDRSFLNQARLANNASLENPDVFYEEEEDAFLAATSESPRHSDDTIPVQAVSSNTKSVDLQSEDGKVSSDTLTREHTSEVNTQQSGLGIQKDGLPEPSEPIAVSTYQDSSRLVGQQCAISQLHNAKNPFSIRPKSPGPAEIIKQELWQRRLGVPPSPDVSPRFLPADNRPSTSPIELTPNIPPFSLQGGSSLSNSSFPSPDFTGSSSDAPRSITTSSTTDRKFSSPYNPSMDFPHASVEDVPSLTSSASTTTNPLNRFSATFFPRPRLSTDRSASFSAAVNRRSSQANSSKRSSLASLSKLVVGSHAERSKLSYEEKPPSDEPEKGKKKNHRISRLMHFWKTKDKDKLNESAVPEEQLS